MLYLFLLELYFYLILICSNWQNQAGLHYLCMTHLPQLQGNLWISAVPSVHALELASEEQKTTQKEQRKPPKQHQQKETMQKRTEARKNWTHKQGQVKMIKSFDRESNGDVL